jgi:hypothetical protein
MHQRTLALTLLFAAALSFRAGAQAGSEAAAGSTSVAATGVSASPNHGRRCSFADTLR